MRHNEYGKNDYILSGYDGEPAIEQHLRHIATTGFDEWLVRRNRRHRRMSYVFMMMLAVGLPVAAYAFTPELKYRSISISQQGNIDMELLCKDVVSVYEIVKRR